MLALPTAYLLSESSEMQAKANEEECIVSVISVAKAATTHVKDQDLNEDTRTRLQEVSDRQCPALSRSLLTRLPLFCRAACCVWHRWH